MGGNIEKYHYQKYRNNLFQQELGVWQFDRRPRLPKLPYIIEFQQALDFF
jgi:hypothetical protein